MQGVRSSETSVRISKLHKVTAQKTVGFKSLTRLLHLCTSGLGVRRGCVPLRSQHGVGQIGHSVPIRVVSQCIQGCIWGDTVHSECEATSGEQSSMAGGYEC